MAILMLASIAVKQHLNDERKSGPLEAPEIEDFSKNYVIPGDKENVLIL